MKIIIFSLVVMVLISSISLAQGLEITRVDAHVDYEDAYIYRIEQEQKNTRRNSALVPVVNDSRIEVDIFPGSNITFTVTIENTFNGDEPVLRDIFTKITIEGKRDESDLKEEDGNFDLKPGNEGKADVKFKIPFEMEDGSHNIKIEAEGEDKDHALYKAEVRLRLDIKKLSHDLRITKVYLTPSIVYCSRKATITTEIANAGSNLEDNVALEFKYRGIGFNSYDKDISLPSFSSGDIEREVTYTKASSIEVPVFLKSGKYPLFVNLYWKNFIIFDQKTVELDVRDCAKGTTPKPKEDNETATVIQPKEGWIPKKLIMATREMSILDSPIILSMLIGGSFIIMVLAGLIVFGLLRKSKV